MIQHAPSRTRQWTSGKQKYSEAGTTDRRKHKLGNPPLFSISGLFDESCTLQRRCWCRRYQACPKGSIACFVVVLMQEERSRSWVSNVG